MSQTFERIVYSQRYLRFPLGFDPHAKSIIRKLLEANSALRLGSLKNGVDDIKEHLFFSAHEVKTEADWNKLERYEFEMEYKPDIKSEDDTSHFPDDGDEEALTIDSAIEEFIVGEKGDQFKGF